MICHIKGRIVAFYIGKCHWLFIELSTDFVLVTKLDEGRLVVDTRHLERQVEGIARRGIAGVLAAGILIGGAVLHASADVAGTVLMIVSAVPALYAIWGARRRRP